MIREADPMRKLKLRQLRILNSKPKQKKAVCASLKKAVHANRPFCLSFYFARARAFTHCHGFYLKVVSRAAYPCAFSFSLSLTDIWKKMKPRMKNTISPETPRFDFCVICVTTPTVSVPRKDAPFPQMSSTPK